MERAEPLPRRRQVAVGPTVIEFNLRRSQRRRRTIEIAVDAAKGVLVAAPARATLASIDDLVRRRASWILQRLAAVETAAHGAIRQWVTGETVLYLGRDYRLRVGAAEGIAAPEVRLDGDCLEVWLPLEEGGGEAETARDVGAVVEQWYRWSAGRYLSQRVDVYAPLLGVEPRQVLVRHQERRWGSCARDGTLRFNWRLVLAPLPIVDYVVVHELCHLLHLNHGPQFWEQVERLVPDYRFRRRELRLEGDRYRL
ncbi:MAG: M48 family metallopeptidase [Chloroflexi bacterium]|nr:M48 family metallopeptidase [Chloroflexota bacterium]